MKGRNPILRKKSDFPSEFGDAGDGDDDTEAGG